MTETVRAVMDRLEAQQAMALQLRPEGNSLEFWQLVYRNASLDLSVRMRAAMACLQHEVPRLAVTAQITDQGVAELLDRRLKRIEEMKLIEAKPPTNGAQTDAKPPLPRLPDRRFRRI